MHCSLIGSSVHGDSPSNNTRVGCHAILQGISPAQDLNPGLLHCRCILYPLGHQGIPRILQWVAYPFSRGSSRPGNPTRIFCIADWVFFLLLFNNSADWVFTRWATKEVPSVQFSRSVLSDSLWPHESQHARPPCPSPTPGVHSNSRQSNRWCHPAICHLILCHPLFLLHPIPPASESYPMSQLFSWRGQSTGISAFASFLPKKSQGWSL